MPDMIFMDRRMPVMDGVTATRRIRELPGGGDIRIAAVTAEAFREDYEGMVAAGCDAFIRKPYKIDEILECIGSIPKVKVIRAESPESPERAVGDYRSAAKAALAELPGELIASLRSACQAADAEEVAALLAPHIGAARAVAPFLREFRTDLIAALLP
jgi:CheY-like chemotaxis protein